MKIAPDSEGSLTFETTFDTTFHSCAITADSAEPNSRSDGDAALSDATRSMARGGGRVVTAKVPALKSPSGRGGAISQRRWTSWWRRHVDLAWAITDRTCTDTTTSPEYSHAVNAGWVPARGVASHDSPGRRRGSRKTLRGT